MILKALYDYGVRTGPPSLAFTQDRVYWILDIGSDGKIHGLTFTGEKRDKRPGYYYPSFTVPNMVEGWGKSRSSGVDPQYLLDNFEYLFGIHDKKGKQKHSLQCANAYRERVRQISERTGLGEMRALLKCLDSVRKNPSIVLKLLATQKGVLAHHMSGTTGSAPKHWTKSQSILVKVSGTSVFDVPEVRADWESLYSQSLDGTPIQCMITGKVAPSVKLHRKIKVPGTEGPGAPIISFNERCFESFGMRGSENTPMSAEAADRVAFAVDSLLKSNKNRYFLPSGATVLFWTGNDDHDDFLNRVLYGDAETVKDLYRSPYTGYQPDEDVNTERFMSLTLRGESGRVSMRSVVTMSHHEVLGNLRRHYEDTGMDGLLYPLTIRSIVENGYRKGDKTASSSGLEDQLYMAAIAGERYPPEILRALLSRCTRMPQGRTKEERRSRLALSIRIAAAYGKAYINRSVRSGRIPPRKKLEERVDKTNESVPYRLGRLLAVLEKLRMQAIPTSPPLSESALSMFLERPQLAFNAHYARHVHHTHKLKGKSIWAKRLIGEILEGVEVVPQGLNLESRSELVIGYEHQKQELYRSKEKDVEVEA